MTYENYTSGAAIHYLGSDGIEYITGVKTYNGAIASVCVERADGAPIVVRGASYPDGYIIGRGEVTARCMYNEAIEHRAMVAL